MSQGLAFSILNDEHWPVMITTHVRLGYIEDVQVSTCLWCFDVVKWTPEQNPKVHTYPVNYGGFCWRKCNIKRRHPGDIRGRTAALASPSRNAEEKVSLECTTRHPIRGKKIGDLKVIQSSFLQVEGMKWWGVAKPNLLFSQTTSTVGKFRHELGSCFFCDPWLLFWSNLQEVKVSLLRGLYKERRGVHF